MQSLCGTHAEVIRLFTPAAFNSPPPSDCAWRRFLYVPLLLFFLKAMFTKDAQLIQNSYYAATAQALPEQAPLKARSPPMFVWLAQGLAGLSATLG